MGNQISNDILDSDTSCRIVVISPSDGEDCLTELSYLPRSARIVAVGNSLEELLKEGYEFCNANVLLNLRGTAQTIAPIVKEMPYLRWMHSVTAGIDHLLCDELINDNEISLTNAKGIYSSSLAEYVMGAIAYFTKDFPRLMKQKQENNWEKYCVSEIRGKTMGIIGYGDIGVACSKLASAYGMNIIALRRNPQLSQDDETLDKIVGPEGLGELLRVSDFVVVATALTKETTGLLGKEQFKLSKKGQIIINVSRGPVIIEDDLIEALQTGHLGGAALDVFCEEPLPVESKFWELPNVLLSPHNADQTVDFRHKSVQFFCENCQRFIANIPLKNIVSASKGY